MERDRCARCDLTLPERGPTSPAIRYCQDCWWETQRLAYAAYEPVDALALPVLERWWRITESNQQTNQPESNNQ